jgi:hypothetical protein
VRDGFGAGGTVGGTEVFKTDGNELTNPAATTYTSASGHTMTVNKLADPSLRIIPKATDSLDVARLYDLSGRGRHMVPGALPPRLDATKNGRPVMTFNGSSALRCNPYMINPPGDLLILAVVLTDSTGTTQRVYASQGSNTHVGPSQWTEGALMYGWLIGGVTWGNAGTAKLNTWDVQTLQRSGGLMLTRSNGTQIGGTLGNTPLAATGYAWLGGDHSPNKVKCRIAEYIVIDGSWTTADRNKTESYLRTKWGI